MFYHRPLFLNGCVWVTANACVPNVFFGSVLSFRCTITVTLIHYTSVVVAAPSSFDKSEVLVVKWYLRVDGCLLIRLICENFVSSFIVIISETTHRRHISILSIYISIIVKKGVSTLSSHVSPKLRVNVVFSMSPQNCTPISKGQRLLKLTANVNLLRLACYNFGNELRV